jgi:hypothetical protein
MAKSRQGHNKPAQEPELSPPKRAAGKQVGINVHSSKARTESSIADRVLPHFQKKIVPTKATHPQARPSPIKSHRRPQSKPAEDTDYTPLKAVTSRDDTKPHRVTYTKLKFHVNQVISTYPSTIYKSFDNDPQPARPQWVSPSFGPEISLQHVREAIIRPDHLPSFMLTPIDRPIRKQDSANSEESEEPTFPALNLTPSTSSFPR